MCRDGEGTERNLTLAKDWLHRLLQKADDKSQIQKEASDLLQQMQEDMF